VVEDGLQSIALPPSERPVDRSLILPECESIIIRLAEWRFRVILASNFVWPLDVPNENEVNSGLCYYCHVGDVADARLRAMLSLYGHISHEPCFDQLRTKEQLGYIVSSTIWHATSSMGWVVIVQSERDPSYVESRVDAFLSTLKDKLGSMTEEEFNSNRDGLIALKLEEPKNMGEEMTRFWSHIKSGYQDFSRSKAHPTARRAILTCVQDSMTLRSSEKLHVKTS